jgi:hypothetical protein
MVNLNRNKIERLYENLIQCYRKVNQLHEEMEIDHSTDEICEKFSSYKRQLPVNLLEKTAEFLDGREGKIVFVSTDDASKALLINGFLSRPGLVPVSKSKDRIPLKIFPVNFAKEEKLELIYQDLNGVIEALNSKEVIRNFLLPFKSQLAENPLLLQGIFNDYLSAMTPVSIPVEGEVVPEVAVVEKPVLTDEVLAAAHIISKKMNRLNGKFRENLDKKDELLTGNVNSDAILAKEAHLYADNVFLKENKLTLIDIPSAALQENSNIKIDEMIAESNCIVVILDVNQLTVKDQIDNFWKKISGNQLLDKTFFVLNGFEKLLKEDLSSNFVSELVNRLKTKLGSEKLDIGRITFASSFRVALAGLMNQPTKTKDDEKTFEELVRSFHEKKQTLNAQMEPSKLEKLKSVYSDGGISQFRNSLLDFISVELLFGRCNLAKESLFQVTEMINSLIGPEKIKVKEFSGPGDPIQKIIEPVTSTYEKVKVEFETGFSDLDKVFAKLGVKLKNKIVKAFKGVETQTWEELIAAKNLTVSSEIIPVLLDKCKEDFSNDFIQITLSEIKTLIKSKFFSTLERGAFQKKIKTLDEQLETNYCEVYDAFENTFLSKVNWAMESKPIELTWSMKKISITPKVGETWTPEIAEQFKNELTNFFANRYAKLVDSLLDCMTEYLFVYYEQYKAGVDKLIERVQSDILKNMEGKKEDKSQLYKKVRKHIKLLHYVKNITEIDKIKSDVVGVLS